ncbi:hypothetical protein [Metabacillus iocasae]|uniref:Uncharacterized protein n=1 Tax=Priestia iocasae TaxID=2291674 RepID=A0ABS2QUT7_9BACI|nr:hypothetical protein [Metabacillus iocasae]MBM7703160.1 hypothetical protein [Metabacillus iocasae]
MTLQQTEQINHQKLAVTYFNETWEFLDKDSRSIEEIEQMIHLAHASFFHWNQVESCTDQNRSIGYWQLSRVYSVATMADQALYYANLCIEISIRTHLEPFYVAYAYEAQARAYAHLQKDDLAKEALHDATTYIKKIESSEAKELVLKDIEEIEEKLK